MDKHFWKSHKFWAAVIAAIVVFGNEFGIDLPPDLMWIALGYMGIRGAVDTGKAVANGRKSVPQASLPPLGDVHIPSVWRDTPTVSTPFFEPQNVTCSPVAGTWDYTSASTGKPPSDPVKQFADIRDRPWMLTNYHDPKQVEVDFIGHYETVLIAAQEAYKHEHGSLPDGPYEPCRSGDWSYTSRWLWHSFRELQIQRDMIAAIKANSTLRHKLLGLGYLLHGTSWEQIPSWAQDALSYHIKGMPTKDWRERI